jgi:hypothetical protein
MEEKSAHAFTLMLCTIAKKFTGLTPKKTQKHYQIDYDNHCYRNLSIIIAMGFLRCWLGEQGQQKQKRTTA